MSMTQFAMVEELAFLVKDNLPCKHLVLSVEEVLVNFLDTDTSCDGTVELEPMNSYNRLLMHRLADIFGFSHESVGEGEDRHLILERGPESSVPSILVSDILWQYDDPQTPIIPHQLLKRSDEALPVKTTKSTSTTHSFEEREAAYLAARRRIFSLDLGSDNESVKQKPRSVPVVAQRMISHALGKRINPSYKGISSPGAQTDQSNIRGNASTELKPSVKGSPETISGSEKGTEKQSGKVSTGRERCVDLKKENFGAAKRLFANALGMPKPGESKH